MKIDAQNIVSDFAWDKYQNSVEFGIHKIVKCKNSITKRSVLSTIAAVFDPLRLLSWKTLPFTLIKNPNTAP